MANDFRGIAQKLKMHRVLNDVVTEPIKPVVFEHGDPLLRHHHALVHRELLVLAEPMFAPRLHTIAARVQRRIDVDGDAKDVVGDLCAAIGVFRPDP